MIKEYNFTNFNQLGEVVNSENLERLSKDLSLWLALVVKAKQEILIDNYVFVWLDDGQHKAFIQLTDKKTGEVTRIGELE